MAQALWLLVLGLMLGFPRAGAFEDQGNHYLQVGDAECLDQNAQERESGGRPVRRWGSTTFT